MSSAASDRSAAGESPAARTTTRKTSGPFFTRLSAIRWRIAAVVSAAAYAAQDLFGWRVDTLASFQAEDAYAILSGVLLAGYVAWVASHFASRPQGAALRRRTLLHQRAGAAAPVLLYLHSGETGYGFTALLSLVFLGTVLVGVASPFGLRMRNPPYHDVWVAAHIFFAAFLAILILFHAYIAVYYE